MPSNATETIDARILRLIGLEDIFDLDYDTYITLLKEAAVKGRMPKTTIPIEEVELLTEELKRVKSKKDKGRFKVKKKKITATALKTGGGGILKGKKTSIPTSRLLPAAQTGSDSGGFNVGESFAKIAESVTSIAKTLKEKFLLSKKEAAFDRRADERERRKLQKENLKKRFAKMAAVAQKILQPVQSLLDKIINYFAMIFLGRVVIKLLDWFSKDENQKKVKSFVRFIGDWWPALLGGFLLFGTGIGGLIASFVPMVVGWTVKLAAVIGGSALLKTALAAVGLFTAGAFLPKLFPGLVNEDVEPGGPGDHSWGGHEDKQRRTTDQAQKGGPGDYSWGGYEDKKIQGLSNGGWIVPGSGSGDTVPAMLTPGESVLQVGARERLIEETGVDPLSANIGPNANKPQMMGGTMFASRGGMVGRESGSPRVPPWKDVGAKVLDGLSSAGFPGFGGETSKSSNYWVRAANEVVKHTVNSLKSDGGGGSSSSSRDYSMVDDTIKARAQQIVEKSSQLYSAAQPHIQSLPSMVDMGSLYLKSQFGGMGGAITEADLSKQTKDEYKRAFAVAKAKVPVRMAGVESVIRQQQAILSRSGISKEERKAAQRILNINKSRLARYKRGEVDVQYEDFQVDGKVSPTANAARKTMGAVWASSTKDGGIKIQKEPYDFPIIKDPHEFMFWKGMSKEQKYAWLDKQDKNNTIRKKLDDRPPYKGSLGNWNNQDRAEAMFSLNPFASSMTTDVKIGGKTRPEAILDSIVNVVDSPITSLGRGLMMNLLFGKDRDVTKGLLEGASSDSLYGQLFSEEQSKPKAQISSQQKPKTAPPPPSSVGLNDPELFANTGTGRDGTFGEGTYGEGMPSNPPTYSNVPSIPLPGGYSIKLSVLGLGK